MGVKKAAIGVAAVVLVAGVSGGAYAAVTSDERALANEYEAYEKAYSQVEKKVKDLAPINDGCVVDMNNKDLNGLCEGLDKALAGTPEKVKVDVDKVKRGDVDKTRKQVAQARKELDKAAVNINKAYEAAEPELDKARDVFVGEVDKVVKVAKTASQDAQAVIDAAKEVKVDSQELADAKAKADEVVASLESDRDTMRRSTHSETVAELKKDNESVDTLTAATLVVVADKDAKVAEKAVKATEKRLSVDKAAEKVVNAQASGKLNTKSGVGASAVATPKAQATAQAKSNTSGAGGNYRTGHGQTTYTQNGGRIYHNGLAYTTPNGVTHWQTDISGQALSDMDGDWLTVDGDGADSVFYVN